MIGAFPVIGVGCSLADLQLVSVRIGPQAIRLCFFLFVFTEALPETDVQRSKKGKTFR
jgi:hypothetical protein